MMLSFLLFLLDAAAPTQAPAPVSELQWFASLGVGGVLAAGMAAVWRKERAASEVRYGELSKEFRTIVEENTRAITTLVTVVEQRGLVDCPYAKEARRQ